MGTGPFPGVKQPGRGVDQPPPYGAEVKERVELYLYSTSGPSWPVLGRTLLLPLPLFLLHSQHIVFHLHCSLVARDIIDRLVSVTLSICVVVETKPCLVVKKVGKGKTWPLNTASGNQLQHRTVATQFASGSFLKNADFCGVKKKSLLLRLGVPLIHLCPGITLQHDRPCDAFNCSYIPSGDVSERTFLVRSSLARNLFEICLPVHSF